MDKNPNEKEIKKVIKTHPNHCRGVIHEYNDRRRININGVTKFNDNNIF